MPCTPGVTPPIPELPAGITVEPPAEPSPPDFDPNLCCKIVTFPKVPVAPPIPAAIVAVAAPALRQFLKTVTDFVEQLPRACPRE